MLLPAIPTRSAPCPACHAAAAIPTLIRPARSPHLPPRPTRSSGRCVTLEELNLDHNKLRSIPMSICSLTNLREVRPKLSSRPAL